ncbi:transporter, permease [Legionella beliardensis]|uniref:Transporter, permease n=1 Tax=Legionella beliardensis TaxID=91822 RepID=A0A378I013_9GAMM|nr:AI-2E family transporter [Legionella beliardensis]STX28091.1 transporter, permease [Legionella beliardensis]
MNRTVTFAAGTVLVCLIGFLLIVGSGLLIPLVLAIFIWNLLNTINVSMQHIPVFGVRLPSWLRMVLSLLVVTLLVMILVNIISNNVIEVIDAAPRYQENLMGIFKGIDDFFHIKMLARFDSFIKNLSVQNLLVGVYSVFTTVTGSAVLITLYVVFLFVEQHFLRQKMDALFPQTEHREIVDNIINHIVHDTQTYLGIKTLLSVITALTSWVLMKIVGLDFAEFWALLIFFLNFIPNIGAIIATVFPALLAMIQFDNWLPFLIISIGFVFIHFIIGNYLEPKYLGKSLNLSPLIILFSLALWGAIWGVLGMFLAVPITVMMMIVFAHFDKTRPIAIILSQDGYIRKAYEKLPVEE